MSTRRAFTEQEIAAIRDLYEHEAGVSDPVFMAPAEVLSLIASYEKERERAAAATRRASDQLALLQAIRQALDIPHASPAGEAARGQVITRRVHHVVEILRWALDDPVPWHIGPGARLLAQRMETIPLTYAQTAGAHLAPAQPNEFQYCTTPSICAPARRCTCPRWDR
ncbi:hypothetical protein HNP84_007356 [Thermocatellispora tengchongensis]|uniref:Uncharacterized protein n=1 Tax=Thermocatellispora tengchongensis TaxID=1073253 RepID=A0A840P8B3_9ACTN|nr:hypothetical protein [Thermocatellispora tengchongensis]MBB5137604.1 hypothetical protein [Thermocatellispora tengchongensis]